MKNLLPYLMLLVVIAGCAPQPMVKFSAREQPPPPDYSNPAHWAALPFREDAADIIPDYEEWVSDSLKEVDVFYVYPTIYQGKKVWNANVNNKKLNKKIDRLPVRYQASVFNRVGRVYAPRYRQATIHSFTGDGEEGRKALDFAYEDVKAAFEYYMEHYNDGRPIIIASHSQGTTHCRELLKDYFDTPEMKARLVCAYIVGFRVYPDAYELLEPCSTATEINCYVTWSSFREGYYYNDSLEYYGKVCVNPISWSLDTLPACSEGGIFLSINRQKTFYSEARRKDNFLWVDTETPIVRRWKNLHLVDYNLFWHDIRKNAKLRSEVYLSR